MVDPLSIGIVVALGGLVPLIKPLIASLFSREEKKLKKVNITVTTDDGSKKQIELNLSDKRQDEKKLKQLMELLSEAGHARTENSPKE